MLPFHKKIAKTVVNIDGNQLDVISGSLSPPEMGEAKPGQASGIPARYENFDVARSSKQPITHPSP